MGQCGANGKASVSNSIGRISRSYCSVEDGNLNGQLYELTKKMTLARDVRVYYLLERWQTYHITIGVRGKSMVE